MDIRAEKSRNKIINTFFRLRSKKNLEKITVTEICKIAKINKSTFYAHFHDIYDLSDYLETQLVDEILSTVEHPENSVFDKKSFTVEIAKAYIANTDKIEIIFSGSRSVFLPQRISKSIKNFVFERYPELANDSKTNISLTYSIYGGFYTYNENIKYGADKIVKVISEIEDVNFST